MKWVKWEEEKPLNGDKVVLVCDDGCSSFIAYTIDSGLLHAEDGMNVSDSVTKNSLWSKLPDDYEIRFTSITEEDWY